MSGLLDSIAKFVPFLSDKIRKHPTWGKGQMVASEKIILLNEWAPSRDIDFYRTLLVGLSVDCPMDKAADNCFLQNERSLSFDEKVNWAQSLSDSEIMDLYMLHHKCPTPLKGWQIIDGEVREVEPMRGSSPTQTAAMRRSAQKAICMFNRERFQWRSGYPPQRYGVRPACGMSHPEKGRDERILAGAPQRPRQVRCSSVLGNLLIFNVSEMAKVEG
ncbi:MAG: hypothetical protein RQ754_15980 [Desulfuromonadales bacterium]|nr:hypothetical protein [Desulfuromonadales bacterium]